MFAFLKAFYNRNSLTPIFAQPNILKKETLTRKKNIDKFKSVFIGSR